MMTTGSLLLLGDQVEEGKGIKQLFSPNFPLTID
jgi:hypothetical protein